MVKEFICRLANSVLDCDAELEQALKKMAEEKKELEKDNREYNRALKNCQNFGVDLQKQVGGLKDQVALLEVEVNRGRPMLAFRHPEANISYKKLMLAGKQKVFTMKPVRTFITPNDDVIQKDIKKNDLYYEPDRDLDELVPQLYRRARRGYKYQSDLEVFGFSEAWLEPWESRKLLEMGRGLDCEDWAHIIGSYFACAGVPRDKWWVSCGETRSGFGHSTVYAMDDMGRWRHLNSTGGSFKTSLENYPHKDDEKDVIGIDPEKFWFSFNDYFAMHEFESMEAKAGFKKEKAMKNITIRRVK